MKARVSFVSVTQRATRHHHNNCRNNQNTSHKHHVRGQPSLSSFSIARTVTSPSSRLSSPLSRSSASYKLPSYQRTSSEYHAQLLSYCNNIVNRRFFASTTPSSPSSTQSASRSSASPPKSISSTFQAKVQQSHHHDHDHDHDHSNCGHDHHHHHHHAQPTPVNPAASSAPSSQHIPASSYDYCMDSVRKFSRENYFPILLIKNPVAREATAAVYTFNIETANVRDSAINPRAAQLRFSWWRTLIEQLYQGKRVEHPIGPSLMHAIQTYKLTKTWLKRIIDAREKDVDGRIPLSLEEVEKYAENTQSSLLYLALECNGIKNTNADHAASHIGKAIGLITLIRGTPYHAARRQSYIPLSLAHKHSLVEEDLFKGQSTKPLQECIYEMASQAKVHLDHARDLKSSMPPGANTPLLSAKNCDYYLKNLQKHGFNVFDSKTQRGDPFAAAKLWWANRTNAY